MTLQAKITEREIIGRAEGKAEGKAEGIAMMVLQALEGCKSISTTSSFLRISPDYVRQVALDNGLTDLVDLAQP